VTQSVTDSNAAVRTLLVLAFASFALHAECVPVTGIRLFGSDLARADLRYSTLPAGLAVGFAPSPGSRRVFPASELARIARANGLAIDSPADLCFEFPVRAITGDEAMTAIRKSVPANAKVEIVNLSPDEVPGGELRFPPDGFNAQHWRGYVLYAGNLRAPVWADVRLSIPVISLIAVRDLPAEVEIDPASVRAETTTVSSLREIAVLRPAVLQPDDVKGLAPRSGIRAGAVIHRADLEAAPAVRRGDPIRVEVESGRARLHFDAVAEASARVGDVIELRSPLGGKSFRARLESSSKAVVVLGEKPL
jgi:flagella basal body P-ring formation protein FlgA